MSMSKIFNVSADCKPELHYMVDIGGRLREIKRMVDRGGVFYHKPCPPVWKNDDTKSVKTLFDKRIYCY